MLKIFSNSFTHVIYLVFMKKSQHIGCIFSDTGIALVVLDVLSVDTHNISVL